MKKNLIIGPNNMNKANKLDIKDVLAIIKTAADCHVKQISFNGLVVEYGVPDKTPEAPKKSPFPVDAPTIERADDPPNQEEKKAIEEVEELLKLAELDRLQLENPLEFERLVAQGEIDVEENGSTEP